MTKTATTITVETLQTLIGLTMYSDRTVRAGTHLIGAGSARQGFAAYTAAGDGMFLGRTHADAVARACDLIKDACEQFA